MTAAEEICRHLQLNPRAGLGWRLCRARVERSRRSPGRYTIAAADDVETALLVRALSVRAAMVSSAKSGKGPTRRLTLSPPAARI